MGNISRFLSITVLTAVVCLSGYKLLGISWQYAHEEQVREQLMKYRQEQLTGPSPNKLMDHSPEHPSEAQSNPFITDLQNEINKDIAGWLTIPNTLIDYAFVMPQDNDFYLKHDLYGEEAAAGSLFMDCNASKDFTDFNTFIYGHKMKNNSMLSDIALFSEVEFFDANKYGTIFLEDRTLTLEIFAYMVIRSDDEIIYCGPFERAADRKAFWAYIEENACNFREPDKKGRVVTLSTCSYAFNDARSVLLANVY